MSALNLKDILNQQIKIIEDESNIRLPGNTYQGLKDTYDLCHEIGIATKHSTHDSIFYIMEDSKGFKCIKFYNDSTDYRTAYFESSGVAYSMALCAL